MENINFPGDKIRGTRKVNKGHQSMYLTISKKSIILQHFTILKVYSWFFQTLFYILVKNSLCNLKISWNII